MFNAGQSAYRLYGGHMKRKDSENLISCACAPRLELTGNTECIVEGIKGIPQYNEEKITIDLGKFSVSIFGDGLYINSFTPQGAVIEGAIVSMEFEGYA